MKRSIALARGARARAVKALSSADIRALIPSREARALLGMAVSIAVTPMFGGTVVTIKGPASSGKTRLAKHLIGLIEQLGARADGYTVELSSPALLKKERAVCGLIRTYVVGSKQICIRELLTCGQSGR